MSHNENLNISLGQLVRQLRQLKGISQQTLATELGYSRRQIGRIEAGEVELARELTNLLSNYFNVDIEQYISISKTFSNSGNYIDYVNLRKAIEHLDLDNISEYHKKLINIDEYNVGENLQLLLYAEGMLLSYRENNFIESNFCCFKALDTYKYNDYITLLKSTILTEMSYPILFLMQYNYDMLGEHDIVLELAIELVNHFESLVFNNLVPIKKDMYFMRKYYIISLNNLSHVYFVSNIYSKALEYIDRSISLSNEYGISIVMYYLYRLKFEIYYMMNDIEKSKEFYIVFKNACMFTSKMNYFNDIQVELKSKYPLLFDEDDKLT